MPNRLHAQGAMWALVVLGATVWAIGRVAGPVSAPVPPETCPRPQSVWLDRGFTRGVACTDQPGGARTLHGPARWLFGHRVPIADADLRLLETLPSIGPARAHAIVAEREGRPFVSLDDRDRVYGIGPSIIERLRPFVRIDPPRVDRARGDAEHSAKPDREG